MAVAVPKGRHGPPRTPHDSLKESMRFFVIKFDEFFYLVLVCQKGSSWSNADIRISREPGGWWKLWVGTAGS